MLLFQAIVLSPIEYALSILTLSAIQIERLEKVQNEAMRIILGCTKDTPCVTMRLLLDFPTMENRIRSFEDLIVWQKAIEFVKQVYLVTNQGDLKRDFGLRDQMRRASVSIPTNIAEGFERSSRKEYLLFLNIAKGSAGEMRSLIRVALEVR